MNINNDNLNIKNKKLHTVSDTIYGISKKQIKYICHNVGINPNISFDFLTPVLLNRINEILSKNYLTNKDLQYRTRSNLRMKILTNSYRGQRLKYHLPSRGQNTHSNGKIAKRNYS